MINVDPIELFQFFEQKNFKYFFHANTVTTSCTFIQKNGLYSRGAIETMGLMQTEQSSDDIDKQFGVWNDIFIDLFDLHGYFPRQNLYGPVCFVLDNSFLLDKNLPNICITKNNPIYWNNDMSDTDKYYTSVKEYADEFECNKRKKCLQQKMFTIHSTDKHIPLKKYLVQIVLDNPRVKVGEVSLYNEAKKALSKALTEASYSEKILKTRECTNCYCHGNYLNRIDVQELEKLFLI